MEFLSEEENIFSRMFQRREEDEDLGGYPADMDYQEEETSVTEPVLSVDLLPEPASQPEPEQQADRVLAEPVQRGRYRLAGKKIAMTFPQYDEDPATMLQKIKDRWTEDGIKWCVVAREDHQDGSKHLHIGLWLTRTFQSVRPDCLDFLAGKHGNYKMMHDPPGWVEYITKDDDYVFYGITPSVYLRARKKKKSTSFLEVALLIQEGSTTEQVNVLHPGFCLQHLRKCRDYEAFCVMNVPQSLIAWSPLNLEDLTGPCLEVSIWLNSNLSQPRPFGKKQLLIIGPTGVGKTSLVEALSSFQRIYSVPMNEDWYCHYSDVKYDLMIFDEYRSQKTIQFMNQFVEGSVCQYKIKGGAAGLKRKNMPAIVLSNYQPSQMYPTVQAQRPECIATFERRFQIVNLNNEQNLYDIIDLLNERVVDQ